LDVGLANAMAVQDNPVTYPISYPVIVSGRSCLENFSLGIEPRVARTLAAWQAESRLLKSSDLEGYFA
jgi:hypothetical protein